MLRARQSSPSCLSSTTPTAAVLLQRFGPQCRPRSRCQRLQAMLDERELQIKLAIASSTDRLDFSDCQLTELPAAVFDLTGLIELSLAGNQLQTLPADISKLTGLKKLVLAGNLFTQLPVELFGLTSLEGLWVHGNLLQEMPQQLGQLTKLKNLSLAGNCLTHIPDSLTQCVHLQDLNLSGNQLAALPDCVGAWTDLQKLSVHGNQLQQLPQQGWEQLQKLDEVCVQGNQLTSLPDGLAKLGALTELSIADNNIRQLPQDLSGLTALRKAHFYGNQLTELPMGPDGLPSLLLASRRDAAGSNGGSDGSSKGAQGPLLSSLWLEANPLSEQAVLQLLELAEGAAAAASSSGSNGSSGGKRGKQPRIGLDDRQLSGRVLEEWQQQQRGCSVVRRGIVKGEGPGYFKLQLGPTAAWDGSGSSERVLVVALGSAPGLPNWGGILAKVAAMAEKPEEECFDVLYVVDPYRSWYNGGDADLMHQQYASRLQQYTQQYKHVVMMGDSMGATAALLFSPLATKVMSFCPQVNLATSSIRPGQPAAWQSAMQETLQESVAASKAAITVFTGTWQHDVDQAELLKHHKHVRIKVHSVDSHRLALALAAREKLAPMLREAILSEVGLSSGNVRLSNLL